MSYDSQHSSLVSGATTDPLPVFVCCARENRAELRALSMHLAALRGKVALLHFDNLPAGSNVRELQQDRLRSSRFVIVLITAELLASNDCQAEVELASQIADSGSLEILPVLVKACVLGATPLADLTLLPRSGAAISQSLNPDDVWAEVANEIAVRVSTPRPTSEAIPFLRQALTTSRPARSLLILDATGVPHLGDTLCAHLSTDFSITISRGPDSDDYKTFDCVVLCVPPDTTHPDWMSLALMLAGASDERRDGRIAILRPCGSDLLFGTMPDMKWVDYDASVVAHGAFLVGIHQHAMALRRAFASVRPKAAPARVHRPRDVKETHLSIRRLYSLIVELRDVLIALPTSFNSSIKNKAQFQEMKETVASNVRRIAEPFRTDAENCEALREFDLLVAETNNLVRTLPYPTEPFLEGKSFSDALQSILAIAFRAASEEDVGLKGATKAVETDIYRRLDKIVSAYIDWWRDGHRRLRDATAQLHDTLTDALISLNGKLLEQQGLK